MAKSEIWTVIPTGNHKVQEGMPGPPGKDGKDGKAYEDFHFDMSSVGITKDIIIENLIYRLECIADNGNLRMYLGSNTGTNILTDFKRVGQYEGGIEVNVQDNKQINAMTSIDDTIYSNSLELNVVRIRQQNPTTNKWSICDVRLFASAGSKRVDVFVDWIAKDIEYT